MTQHLQCKKFNILLKFCVKMLFCRHYVFQSAQHIYENKGSGSVPLTNGSERPKNVRILRIRIPNTGFFTLFMNVRSYVCEPVTGTSLTHPWMGGGCGPARNSPGSAGYQRPRSDQPACTQRATNRLIGAHPWCCGSMTFWCGSGSTDPCFLTNGSGFGSESCYFVIDLQLQDANKK